MNLVKKFFQAASAIALVCGMIVSAPAQESPQPQQKGKRALAKSKLPASVVVHSDIAYVPDGDEQQKLDLFVPVTKTGAKLPLIIWVHGGGWRNGSKSNCFPLEQGFSKRGYAVASIGYRLSDVACFPAQIEDCKAAVRWLRANAEKYNIDPNQFVAWGSSAGGHLVALLGTTGEIRTFDKGGNPAVSSAVQVVIDYFGPSDFVANADSRPKDDVLSDENSPLGKLLGGPLSQNRDKAAAASPVIYVSKAAAPTFILHGTDDDAVPIDQSRRLFTALEKSGAIVKMKTIPNARHGGPPFSTTETLDEVDAFIHEHLEAAVSK